MATRIYLPSSGAAAVTPSTWNFANQINPVTFAGVRTRITSVMTSKTEATGTTNPTARAMGRHVIGPLIGQSISGTVKGQMRGLENNAGANATLAIAIKIIQPGGADRAVLLAQTAADATTTPPELAAALTNRKFENASEVAAIPLTTQTATEGDYLVIEWGFRSATGTTRNITLSYGDDSGTDLPEDTSTTAANNPWIEFSGNITFIVSGTTAMTGTGTLTAAARLDILARTALTGTGTLTAIGVLNVLASTALTGLGTLNAAGIVNVLGTVSLTGIGIMVALSQVDIIAIAILNGAGTLIAVGTVEAGAGGGGYTWQYCSHGNPEHALLTGSSISQFIVIGISRKTV